MTVDFLRSIIKESRKKYKIKQEDLARKIGVSTSLISKFESGESNLSLNVFFKIIKELQLKIFIVDDFTGKLIK